MGASIRKIETVKALSGCDNLTMPTSVLEMLVDVNEKIDRSLTVEKAKADGVQKMNEIDEETFRWVLNEDEMATEKIAEGIRLFARGK